MVVEKPFGHDRASARALADELHAYDRRVPALPDRSLPGEDGHRGDRPSAVRELDARADLEPQLRLVGADHDGGGLRRRGPRPLLRSGRGAARRRRQPPDAGRLRCVRWRRPRAATRRRSRTPRSRSSARSRRPIRRTTSAGSTTATARSTASLRTRPPRPYAALRLEIENWRWAGVPFFIRTGKRLPVTQTELRLVLQASAAAGLPGVRARRRAEPARRQARPVDGGPARSSRRIARIGPAARSSSTWSSPPRAARARRRTRCCCMPPWSATARASPARTRSRSRGG